LADRAHLVRIACTRYEPYQESYTASDGRTVPLLFLPYPEHRTLAEASWGRVPAMLAAFEERFGAYPFADEKYGMAEFFWAGSMENQTLTHECGGRDEANDGRSPTAAHLRRDLLGERVAERDRRGSEKPVGSVNRGSDL
jgi:hypothetical protein